MFTGIVEQVGTIQQITPEKKRVRFALSVNGWRDLKIGESVSVNGACLTVVRQKKHLMEVQAIPTTLRATNLKTLKKGDAVNLERALRVGDRLSGHWVQGHVDGVGKIISIRKSDDEWQFKIQSPQNLLPYFLEKGSVSVDGISLTIQKVQEHSFDISIIPHTLAVTNLKNRKKGDGVNLEVDVLAKYAYEWMRRGQGECV